VKFFKNQLTVLERGIPKKPGIHWVVLAWHWNWSLTWSFIIWWWSPWSNHFGIDKRWYRKYFGMWLFAKQETLRKTEREHKFTGEMCLVGHFDERGNIMQGCKKCVNCDWVEWPYDSKCEPKGE